MTGKQIHRLVCYLPLLLLAGGGLLQAQDSTGLIRSFMHQLQAKYRSAGYLGFHIKYLYANDGRVAAPVDSAMGEMEMHGNNCRMLLDNTETIVTDKYTIQVRPEEKIIILSGTHVTGNMDPLGVIDSALAHTGGAQPRLIHQPGEDILAVTFPPGGQFTHVRIVVDARTGLLRRITYALQTAAWVAEDMISRPGHPALYQPNGHIDIVFSQYRQDGFNEGLFNEENYFNKVGSRYEAAGRYKEYQIFLASSNL